MFFRYERRWIVLAAVCLGLFMVQVDTLALNLALSRIAESFRVGIRPLQWTADLYNLAYASLLLSGGALGDRFGRKNIFVIGISLFLAGSLMSAGAASIGALLVGRLVQGVGAALAVPATLAILRVTFVEPDESSRAMAAWASVSGLAVAFGPTFGGWLVTHAGWQSIFILNLPIGAASLLLTSLSVVDRHRSRSRSIDLPGQLLAAAFLSFVAYLIIQGRGSSSVATIVTTLFAALCMVLFLRRELKTEAPMIPLAMFRSPAFSGAVLAATSMTFAMYGLLFTLGIYLESVVGLSGVVAGLAYLPSSLSFVAVSTLAGRISGRVRPQRLMFAGLLCIGIGLVTLTGLHPATGPHSAKPWDDDSLVRLIAGMAFTGIGMGLNTGPAVAVAVGSVEHERAGIASAVVNLGRMLGATLGVAVFGAVAVRGGGEGARYVASMAAVAKQAFVTGMHRAFWLGAAIVGAGAVLALATSGGLFNRGRPRRQK